MCSSDLLKKVMAGNWKTREFGAFIPMSEGGTDIAGFGPGVPKDKVAMINKERDAIMKGKQIYTGPMVDRDGKERIAKGAVLSDGDLWKMDWFVKGVIAQK